jgi:polysaccharide export outer membrane protein
MHHSFVSDMRLSLVRLCVFAALLAGVTPPASLAAQAAVAEPNGIVLQPGDVLDVNVWRRPEYSGQFTIAADGTVIHPIFRGVHAAGENLRTIEDQFRTVLVKLEADPQFVIAPLVRVAVEGEVRQPNLLTVPAGTTISQAVALAGGPTERARLDRVHLYRNGNDTQLDLTQANERMAEDVVRSGDRIFVTRSISLFRDYIAPAGSIAAAVVSLIAILTR